MSRPFGCALGNSRARCFPDFAFDGVHDLLEIVGLADHFENLQIARLGREFLQPLRVGARDDPSGVAKPVHRTQVLVELPRAIVRRRDVVDDDGGLVLRD